MSDLSISFQIMASPILFVKKICNIWIFADIYTEKFFQKKVKKIFFLSWVLILKLHP